MTRSIGGIHSSHLLDEMLFPLSVNDFLDNHFRTNAIHIERRSSNLSSHNNHQRHHQTNLVSYLCLEHLFNLDICQIFNETSSECIFLWLRPSNPDDPLDSVEISDANTAYKLHTLGAHPAYCRAPPDLENLLVSSLLRSTGLGGGHYKSPHGSENNAPTVGGMSTTLGRGEVELFIGTTSPISAATAAPSSNDESIDASSFDNKKRSRSSSSSNSNSSSRRHATGWHTDFQENFTIQLSGIKCWTVRRGRIQHPLRGTTPHFVRDVGVVEDQLKAARLLCHPSSSSSTSSSCYTKNSSEYGFEYNNSNAYGPEQTVTLYPGDVLYFPAGMWHKVETLEDGISLNVSLMGTTYAKLVCDSLHHLLLSSGDNGWREIVQVRPSTTNDGGGEIGRLQGLLAGLGRLVDDFVTNKGGAQCLLPPALCYPPLTSTMMGQNNEDDGECDGSSNDEESATAEEDNEDEGQPSSGIIVVSVDDFVGPPEWNSLRPPNTRIVKNPLATLIPMADITGDSIRNSDGRKRQYILNVNYAGNEMMESHVRVIFETSEASSIRQMEHYCARGSADKDDDTPPLCLFYYGYFLYV
jgi:hypothetical protein